MWRTRRHGSQRQKGKRFPIREKKFRYKRPSIVPSLVKIVAYSPNKIEVEFAGELLSNSIEVLPHVVWSASWDRKRNVVYIDDNVPVQWRKYLALHETLEKHFAEKGLDPNVAGHETAEALEKRVFLNERSPAEWNEYMQIVDRIHRREYEKVHGTESLAQ
jgi:hypothetical protein